MQKSAKYKPLDFKHKGMFLEGCVGGGGGRGSLWKGSRTEKLRITDHKYKNFVFPNHKNKQVRYSF